MSPDDLDLAFLNRLYTQSRSSDESTEPITSFYLSSLNRGFLSDVLTLTLQPMKVTWIGKFLRPGTEPFTQPMFEREAAFYNGSGLAVAKNNDDKSPTDFPFELPRCIFASPELILMEKIPTHGHISCLDGCPENQIPLLMDKIGRLHGQFWQSHWKSANEEETEEAGIGASLTSPEKEGGFLQRWPAFLQSLQRVAAEASHDDDDDARVLFTAEECHALQTFCEHNLDQLDWPKIDRLSRSNAQMATLIHGDFHIANLVFPLEQDDNNNHHKDDAAVYLVDWSSWGRGHPLRDVVHFFVLSWNWQRRPLSLECFKKQFFSRYYSSLVAAAAPRAIDDISIEEFLQSFYICLWNEFVTIVYYDEMLLEQVARFAETPEKQEKFLHHLETVNCRCARTVLAMLPELSVHLPTVSKG